MDGDLSHDPKDINKLVGIILSKNCDMVIGSRYIFGGKQIGKSWIRDNGSRFLNFFFGYLFDIKLEDFTHTFRAFKKKVFITVKKKLLEKGHPTFLIEFTFWSKLSGFKIIESAVIYNERTSGSQDSKIFIIKEIRRIIFFILRYIILIVKIKFNKNFKFDKNNEKFF